MTKGKEKEVWAAERLEATVPWNGVEGVSVNQEGESRDRQVLAKMARKEKIKLSCVKPGTERFQMF